MNHLETSKLSALVLALVLALPGAGCDEEQVLTTTRNLDRPGPMALVCAGRAGDAGVTTGLSASACTSDGGSGTLYGFVANTGRGEVAVFRPGSNGEPLVDLDRGSPGFGFIPVGGLPSDLKATSDGCRVVTANQGSCDLAVIDVPGVLQLAAGELDVPFGGVVSRVIPRTKSGRVLRARPQEIAMVPASMPDKGQEACPTPGSYRAYVTFPGCNLVAEMDLTTGTILRGVVIGRDGSFPTDEPLCPVECTLRGDKGRVDAGPLDYGPLPDSPVLPDAPTVPDAAQGEAAPGPQDGAAIPDGPRDAGVPDVSPDAGSASDQGAPDSGATGDGTISYTGGVRPHGLAVTPEGDRLYVSSANAGFISVFDVEPDTGAFTTVHRIQLADNVATTRIRLSPKPRNEKVGRFLYAIASDRTVRVIAADLQQPVECETNPDLAAIDAGAVPIEAGRCLIVGGSGTPPRRVTRKGTGLSFGERIPEDVVFVTSRAPASDAGTTDGGAEATPLRGIFALVAVSDGSIYVVDLEDWNTLTEQADTIDVGRLPHRFRNGLQGTEDGVPDASISAVSGAGSGGVPVIVSEVPSSGADGGSALPGEGIFIRAPGEAIASNWDLIYEQRLVSRWSGNLVLTKDSLSIDDNGANFCNAGVLGRQLDGARRPLRHGDIVELVGCEDNDECGLDQICVKPVTTQTDTGLCFDKDREDDLFQLCADFLRGDREYLVTRATQGRLQLDALPVEPQAVIRQPTQPAGGCSTNTDCQAGFLCALEQRAVANRPDLTIDKGECFRPGCNSAADCGSGYCVQPLDGGPRVCAPVPLPLEPQRPSQGKSCTTDADCRAPGGLPASCSKDADCGSPFAECRRAGSQSSSKTCLDKGMTCVDLPGVKGRCVRASPCFTELLRYDVRAGRSFVVGGYGRTIASPNNGECVPDSSESPLLVRRVPIGLATYPAITGPECSTAVSPLTTPSPNPCFERTPTGYVGYTDPAASPPLIARRDPGPATVLRFSNPDIWFSLGLSHLTKIQATESPTDAGVGNTSFNNMPERGLTISLTVNSGYSRMRTSTTQVFALPARMVEGPDNYVYVVDIGNLAGSSGANGQVRRFDREDLALDEFIVR